jgi:tetratricopeptide (TPR) repeat protein
MLDKATALDTTQPAYYKALADAYAATGNSDKAVRSYRQALGLKPDYFEVHSNLGGALLDAGLWEEAVHHYREAVRLRPEIAELHDNLGNALRIAGYCDAAIACHQQALRLKPALVTARINTGSALSKLGRQREAIEAFESALQLAPDMPEAQIHLAALLSSQGRLDRALNHYRAVTRQRPEYLEAVAGEAEVLTEMGERDSARRRLEPHTGVRGRDSAITLAFSALASDAAQQRESIDDLERLLEQGIASAGNCAEYISDWPSCTISWAHTSGHSNTIGRATNSNLTTSTTPSTTAGSSKSFRHSMKAICLAFPGRKMTQNFRSLLSACRAPARR